jgi:drug/metabolite transporter (DMT)-like permease
MLQSFDIRAFSILEFRDLIADSKSFDCSQNMNKDTESFATFVCTFAIFCALVSLILIFLPMFFFTDVDYTEEQRHSVDIYAGLISFFGITGLLFSGFLFFKGLSYSESKSKDSTKKFPR